MQADRVQRMRSRLATHLRTAGGSAAAPVAKTPPVNQEAK
jgi:hypothetical protein